MNYDCLFAIRLLVMLAALHAVSIAYAGPAEVRLAADGKAQAVIVIPDHPSAVAKYAAEEVAAHVEKSTGVRLAVIGESALAKAPPCRVFIGDCRAAREAGIDFNKLAPEAFVLRTKGDSLFIAGDDGNGDPLDMDTRAGTLWGAYEWLERTLNVRWVWPGELGTFVPKRSGVTSAEFDEQAAPHLIQRKIRTGLGFTSEHPALGFTKAAAEKFAREEMVFLRRHRMGRSVHMSYGHAFTDWWKTDGAAHPEWFQLRDNGRRGPSKPTARFSMCVSNPDLQREIVERWKRKSKPDGRTPSFINAVENDYLGSCTCEACRALDGPAPEDYLKHYSPKSKMTGSRFVSDRYAHFWLGVQQLAATTDPHATVIGYVYFNYFQAPTTDVKLNEHILLGFCPSGGFFPRSAGEQEWMKAQWDGWRKTGARLFLRSNHLLDGYVMPCIFVHQFADEFQHFARNEMVATDLDSLTGQWATQGPTLYVALRLHTRPEANVDDLLAEYYSAFGAASPQVKAYFDYWENYTTTNRERISKTMDELGASRWRSWAKAAHVIYPPACFAPADRLLEEAAKSVAADSQALARVEFLRAGLQHAKLCSRAAAQLSLATTPGADAKAALAELIEFRRANEGSGIGNFNHSAWVEDLSWKLDDATRKAPETYP
ncbi:MAG: DUF4838 domain-containing protein [Chthoniobacteraceae bacterium]